MTAMTAIYSLLMYAYSTACCDWSNWGYSSQSDCELDTLNWILQDCLIINFSQVDVQTEACLINETNVLNSCLSDVNAGCDDQINSLCWEDWGIATDNCGSFGWYENICPDMLSCDGGAVEYTSQQRCDGIAECSDGVDEAYCAECIDGTLILQEEICNGFIDCSVGEDEATCFACDSFGNEMIYSPWECDGISDCSNGSDETSCYLCEGNSSYPIPLYAECDEVIDCPNGEDEYLCDGFVCDNGDRIDWSLLCNSNFDCTDGSDEELTLCPVYTCNDGTEIPYEWECDGFSDCIYGEDETGCPTFTCLDGTEIPADWECDGFSDCIYGEDEQRCGLECNTIYGDSNIPEDWVCDGITDCIDNLDEYCSSCDYNQIYYHDSRNVDGIYDCPNGMDERLITSNLWLCSDYSTQIYTSWLCDGYLDCPGGEDEGGMCLSVSIGDCGVATDLHQTQYCDGVFDCSSGYDEPANVCDAVSLDPQTSGNSSSGSSGSYGNGGTSVCSALAYGMCDGFDACSIEVGSSVDEIGCDTNSCDDGTNYPDAVTCDGTSDCVNEKDEDANLHNCR